MKYPTAESLTLKNPFVKIIVTKYPIKKSYIKGKSDCQDSSGKKFYERKLNCKSFKSKGKISNNNKSNEEKVWRLKFSRYKP